MKMKLTLLLIASVFFVSCGMPVIFAPSSSEYTLKQVQPPSLADSVEGKLEMRLQPGPNYDLLQDPKTEGPSLMFFYAFGGKPATDYELDKHISAIQTEFENAYIKNKYDGIPVSDPNQVLSITRDSKKIYLYGVNNSSGTNFKAGDKYVLYAQNQPNQAALDSFTLKKTDASLPEKTYSLTLNWTERTLPVPSPPFFSNASGNTLYDYTGQPFTLLKQEVLDKINNPNNHEYNFVDENSSQIQLHLFAAFFITGTFTNNFWSNLVHLGSIPINLE